MEERLCKHCGKPIPPTRRKLALYCSPKCQRDNYFKEYHNLNPDSGLPSGTIGALGEYRVIIDLLRRGFEVFHAASPSASCDLAVLKSNILYRVEVRTGKYSGSGKIFTTRNHRAEILAIVLPDKIIYQPDTFLS